MDFIFNFVSRSVQLNFVLWYHASFFLLIFYFCLTVRNYAIVILTRGTTRPMILNHCIIPQTKTVKYVLRTTSTFQTYLETTHTQKDRTNQTQMKKDVLALNYHPKINYHCIKQLQSLFELILGSSLQYCKQKLYMHVSYYSHCSYGYISHYEAWIITINNNLKSC